MNNPMSRQELLLRAIALGEEPKITPRSREEMFLVEHAKREAQGGGSGGVSSWKELGETIENTVLVNGEYQTYFIQTMGAFGVNTKYVNPILARPEVITAIVDGETYNDLPVTRIPDVGSIAGNLALLNAAIGSSFANTGEPFVMFVMDMSVTFLVPETEAKTHSLYIEAPARVTVPLPQNYLQIPEFNINEVGFPFPSAGEYRAYTAGVNTPLAVALFEAAEKGMLIRLYGDWEGNRIGGIPSVGQYINTYAYILPILTDTLVFCIMGNPDGTVDLETRVLSNHIYED